MIHIINIRRLRNENENFRVKTGKDPGRLKELNICNRNIMSNHIPIVLIKGNIKAIRPRGSVIIETKDIRLNINDNKDFNKHNIHLIINYLRNARVNQVRVRIGEVRIRK